MPSLPCSPCRCFRPRSPDLLSSCADTRLSQHNWQAYLRVPIGVLIGIVFLGERLSATAWIGLVCVVVGVAAMTVPPRKIAAAVAEPPGTV